MADILDKIIEDKRMEVDRQKQVVGIDELMERCQGLGRCRNFFREVTKPNPRGLNVIAEIKKASPSAGLIRPDFDPVEIALTYQSCGADAISVLTDEKYFQGRLEYLTMVKNAVDVPVLRKDFIIDSYQLYEARAAGADAILLIAEALKPAEIMDLMILASRLTLSVLLEVHCADSLLSVRSLIGFPQKNYSVLGVNNRDLTTMQVDINNTSRMADLLDDGTHLVAESGIKTRGDVEKIIKAGSCAVLIGQTLCRSNSIEDKFKELFG